ncbi:hypothetical protein INT45_009030 [Circinella minor]|uniref:F-box domain-containing protein n=1 Tax=Circinella minor TaxID=1195481 RepID=A0A8H7S9S8_9FUNG|nr:hypothetical protein INT45_009030 [Circinella minor]
MQDKNHQWTDFIVQSPYEIMCNIVSNLDNDSAARCLDVCRIWRHKLLDCPDPWKFMTIDDTVENDTWERHKIMRLLPKILSKHVEKLRVVTLSKHVNQEISLIETGDFYNLKSLVFEYNDGNPFLNLTGSIYSALPHIAHSLTELILDFQAFTDISFDHLLSICQKLESIKLSVRSVTTAATELLPKIRPSEEQHVLSSHLRRFELSSHYPVHVSSIKSLLYRAPHLHSLILRCLFDNEDNDILSALENHCPDLMEFKTGYLDLSYENIIHTNTTDTTTISTETEEISLYNNANSITNNTLQFLEISEVRTTIPLSSRLARSCNSLRVLGLNMDPDGSRHSDINDWRPLSSFIMSNLSILYIRNGCRTFYEHLPLILQRCPSLKSLEIENYQEFNVGFELDEAIRDGLFDSIAGLDKLTRLRLRNFGIHGQGFKRLLESHHYHTIRTVQQQQTQHCISDKSLRLEDLQIYYCEGMDDSVLELIGTISSLRSLTILCNNTDQIHTSIVARFAQSISENVRHLLYLELCGLVLTKEAVQSITECKNLNTLHLRAIAGLTLGHVELLRKHISNVYIEN